MKQFCKLFFCACLLLSCAQHPGSNEITKFGCEGHREGELKTYIEVGRLRCYLHFADYDNARKQIHAVEKMIKKDGSMFGHNVERELLNYKHIYAISTQENAPNQENIVLDGEYWLIEQGEPIYPLEALKGKIEGQVIVGFYISGEGKVIIPIVLESSPPRIFDVSAIAAVRQNRYLPRVIGGDALVVKGIELKLSYALSN